MGCCGDQGEPFVSFIFDPSSSTTATEISPMNSHLSALTSFDILRLIFKKLKVPDLARAIAVNRFWRQVASDENLLARSFMDPWKLDGLVGKPMHGSFWRENSISKFAISHRIRRGDTVTSLAVKYSAQVMDIKRLNNMMSEHGIYSRERLLIPISNPEILVNSTCFIELDAYAKREVAVLYLEPDKNHGRNVCNRVTSNRGRKRIIDSIKRSMQVDDGTAQYYLSVSNDNPRAALAEFSADNIWERGIGVAQ